LQGDILPVTAVISETGIINFQLILQGTWGKQSSLDTACAFSTN